MGRVEWVWGSRLREVGVGVIVMNLVQLLSRLTCDGIYGPQPNTTDRQQIHKAKKTIEVSQSSSF
jgi:hypothetical protein